MLSFQIFLSLLRLYPFSAFCCIGVPRFVGKKLSMHTAPPRRKTASASVPPVPSEIASPSGPTVRLDLRQLAHDRFGNGLQWTMRALCGDFLPTEVQFVSPLQALEILQQLLTESRDSAVETITGLDSLCAFVLSCAATDVQRVYRGFVARRKRSIPSPRKVRVIHSISLSPSLCLKYS